MLGDSSARMEHGTGAYGRYPLLVKIPRAEMHGSTVGFRHTEYVIEVDDCGKVYTRSRRYTMFAWLHAELRHRELACALPELPPKKVLGNRESAFVERRKQMLEDYLKALLMLPAVIQDGMIWAFLDADEATAVVPRFLCRQATHPAAEKCLSALKRAVADKQDEVFRLCDSTVLEELAHFARLEATEDMVAGQMQVRLKNRSKLCFILYKVINYDRARHKLVQSDVFGALLALLCRATDDEAELEMAAEQHNSFWATKCVKSLIQETNGEALLYFCQQEGAVNALRAMAKPQVVALHSLCAWILWFGLRCAGVVTALAGAGGGGTRGLFLLGDLLASPDLCARVLARLCIAWIVRQDGVLDGDARDYCLQELAPLSAELDEEELRAIRKALESGSKDKSMATGGKNIQSDDELWDCDLINFMEGRSLDAFDVFDRHGRQIPLAKHAPESDQFPLQIVLRGEVQSSNLAAGASYASLVPDMAREGGDRRGSGLPGGPSTGPGPSSENLEAAGTVTDKLELPRDAALVKTLAEICQPKELPRLQILLGEADDGELDTVTACVVAVLDHFVLQCEEKDLKEKSSEEQAASLSNNKRNSKVAFVPRESGRQAEDSRAHLQPLIGALERLVKGAAEGMVRGGVGGAAADQPPNVQVSVEEVRVRAARILVRIKGGAEGSVPVPAPMNDFGPRARILEVLMRDSELSQVHALDRVSQTREKCEFQRSRIVDGRLSEDPCVREKDLQGFKQRLRDLTKNRGILRYEVDNLKDDLEAMEVRLQQRCIKHGILAKDVDQLIWDFSQKEDDFMGCQSVLSELEHYEKLQQQHLEEVEVLRTHLRDAEVTAESTCSKEAEAKEKAEALQRYEAELEEFCHAAPAKLEGCQRRLVEVTTQRAACAKQRQESATEVDRSERRLQELKESLKEVRIALVSADAVGKELEDLKSAINSELIMTDAEVRQLKQLAAKLAPTKPARLRRRSGVEEDMRESEASSAREACNEGAPKWDDAAEQDFHQDLHFRALRKLRDERERCWLEEERWLNETLQRTEDNLVKLREQCRDVTKQEQELKQEEEKLKKDIEGLIDPEDHHRRLADAREASANASALRNYLQSAWAEAAGAKEMLKEQLKQKEDEASEVLGPRLQAAQAKATVNEEATKKVRQELQARFQDLEKRARDFLQEWRGLEKKEQGLVLRQERVDNNLDSEAHSRKGLRREVHQLIEMLHQLDHQLDRQ